MKTGLLALALAVALATGLGCAHGPFPAAERVPTDPTVGAAELVAVHWPPRGAGLRIRQTAVLEIRGSRMPMIGLVQLAPEGDSLRMLALNDLGVKLLDMSVTRQGVEAHYVLPGLERQAGLVEVVAESARRIFLTPRPTAEDPLVVGTASYRMEHREGGATYTHTYAGSPPRLTETAGAAWNVGFYQYRELRGAAHPAGVVLADRAAPYRLTLWIEEVKTLDE